MVVLVFTVAFSVIVPLPFPLEGETVSHVDPLLEAVQGTFEVITIAWFPPDADGVQEFCDISSSGWTVPPAWVTVIVLLIPLPETVIIPVLVLVPGLADTFSVIVPLPDPLAGETVNQVVALLAAVQDTFDVTVTVVLSADASGFQVPGDTIISA